MQRLSSGSRINSARDDAAGSAINQALEAQIRSTAQAQRNVGDSFSMSEMASGGLSGITESMERIRELAMQAANGSSSASDRAAIQEEINGHMKGMEQVSQGMKYGDQKLLDGSFATTAQAGPDATDSISFSVGDMTLNGLGLAALDVTTAAGAQAALASLDGALDKVNTEQASLGGAQSAFELTNSNLAQSNENLAAAKSRIADTDYGSTTSDAAQSNLRSQFAMQVQAMQTNMASQLNLVRLIA